MSTTASSKPVGAAAQAAAGKTGKARAGGTRRAGRSWAAMPGPSRSGWQRRSSTCWPACAARVRRPRPWAYRCRVTSRWRRGRCRPWWPGGAAAAGTGPQPGEGGGGLAAALPAARRELSRQQTLVAGRATMGWLRPRHRRPRRRRPTPRASAHASAATGGAGLAGCRVVTRAQPESAGGAAAAAPAAALPPRPSTVRGSSGT